MVLESYADQYGLLVILSLVAVWRFRARLNSAPFIVLLGWITLYLLVYSLILNPPAYDWYYVPFALPCAVLLSAAAALLIGALPSKLRCSGWVLVVLVCGSLFGGNIVRAQIAPTAKHDIYKRAAAWLSTNAPVGAAVASNEVGVLGYYYQKGRIIDPLGLVTKGAAEHVRARRFDWYMHELSPEYVVLKHPPRAELEFFHKEEWFRQRYQRVAFLRGGKLAVRIYRRSAELDRR
ncbi:MAG: hypothetical protein EBZ48_04840 [Proteobacteria bacterium]|nr:hypothetical protein [Pseudomonadota bacterium]